tara:strand:- start:282 stop:800 length:519 start_codon:yes stop_codon:yes gene_type:complete
MARKITLRSGIASKANVPVKAVKALTSREYLNEVRAAVDYIWAKLQADDSTLASSMELTIATATTELAQIPKQFRSILEKASTSNFFCSWETTIPFIVNGTTVITFNRTDSAEEAPFAKSFANAIEYYCASRLNNKLGRKMKSDRRKAKVRRRKTTTESALDTEIASMVTTY